MKEGDFVIVQPRIARMNARAFARSADPTRAAAIKKWFASSHKIKMITRDPYNNDLNSIAYLDCPQDLGICYGSYTVYLANLRLYEPKKKAKGCDCSWAPCVENRSHK